MLDSSDMLDSSAWNVANTNCFLDETYLLLHTLKWLDFPTNSFLCIIKSWMTHTRRVSVFIIF
jgi:hypothetical protein